MVDDCSNTRLSLLTKTHGGPIGIFVLTESLMRLSVIFSSSSVLVVSELDEKHREQNANHDGEGGAHPGRSTKLIFQQNKNLPVSVHKTSTQLRIMQTSSRHRVSIPNLNRVGGLTQPPCS